MLTLHARCICACSGGRRGGVRGDRSVPVGFVIQPPCLQRAHTTPDTAPWSAHARSPRLVLISWESDYWEERPRKQSHLPRSKTKTDPPLCDNRGPADSPGRSRLFRAGGGGRSCRGKPTSRAGARHWPSSGPAASISATLDARLISPRSSNRRRNSGLCWSFTTLNQPESRSNQSF